MDKKSMRLRLAKFRDRADSEGWTFERRLSHCPIINVHRLFNTMEFPVCNLTVGKCQGVFRKKGDFRFTAALWPCTVFSRQLVFKIVDELLDERGA